MNTYFDLILYFIGHGIGIRYTYLLRFILKGVAEASRTFFRVAHVLPTRLSYEEFNIYLF
jgi:hypothetical protein